MWWYGCPECVVKSNRGLSKLTITTAKTLKLHTNGPLLRYPTQRDINVKNVSISCRHENIRYLTKNTYHGMVCTVLCIIGQQPQVTWATDSSLNTDPKRNGKLDGWIFSIHLVQVYDTHYLKCPILFTGNNGFQLMQFIAAPLTIIAIC